MPHQAKSSQITLRKKIKEFLSQGKSRFYLTEIVEESRVSIREAEDFFLPLLNRNQVEGTLQLRCPNCGAHQGSFRKYADIPSDIRCELCDYEFPRSDEYLDIVLEVKGKFFRGQRGPFEPHRTENHQARNGKVAARCSR